MLYTFTLGVLASLFTKLLGQGAIFAVILFLIGLNFPSTGGGSPESILPPFWQFLHSGWVGSRALEAMRSVLYFDGHQVGRWFGHLAVWTGGALVLTFLVAAMRRRRSAADASETIPSDGGAAIGGF